ncbi:MAG: ABC transporter ATP-binding protein [Patescibacteria group bacterium]
MTLPMPTPPPVIRFEDVAKSYGSGNAKTHALRGVSFDILPGSLTAIIGPSGSGKSTLLNLIGLLDQPTNGKYFLDSVLTNDLKNDDDRARLRREKLGFIFQQFNLLPRASAIDNVAMPAIYTQLTNRNLRATYLLKAVGLSHRLHHRPNQLSGGEQQRVAIARSLINSPKVLLADEPTGNLDSETGQNILELLQELNRDGQTVVIVTHDPAIAKLAHQVIEMKDGSIV